MLQTIRAPHSFVGRGLPDDTKQQHGGKVNIVHLHILYTKSADFPFNISIYVVQ